MLAPGTSVDDAVLGLEALVGHLTAVTPSRSVLHKYTAVRTLAHGLLLYLCFCLEILYDNEGKVCICTNSYIVKSQ